MSRFSVLSLMICVADMGDTSEFETLGVNPMLL